MCLNLFSLIEKVNECLEFFHPVKSLLPEYSIKIYIKIKKDSLLVVMEDDINEFE